VQHVVRIDANGSNCQQIFGIREALVLFIIYLRSFFYPTNQSKVGLRHTKTFSLLLQS